PDLLGLNALEGGQTVTPTYRLHNGQPALNAGPFVSSGASGLPNFGQMTSGDSNGDGRMDFANLPMGSMVNSNSTIDDRISVRLGTGTSALAEHTALNGANFLPYCDAGRPYGSFCMRTAVD